MRQNRLLHLLIYTTAITTLFLLPSGNHGGQPTWLNYIGADKAFHALVFFGFVWFYMRWRGRKSLREWLLLFVMAAVFGFCVELAQSLTGTHTCSFWDWLADMSGVFAGFAFIQRQNERLRQARQDSPPSISPHAQAPLPSKHQDEQPDL